jgi:hypothetical protein
MNTVSILQQTKFILPGTMRFGFILNAALHPVGSIASGLHVRKTQRNVMDFKCDHIFL